MDPVSTVNRWPCTACGADLTYAPGQTDLVCPYCGQSQSIAPASAADKARALGEVPLALGLAAVATEGAGADAALSEEVRSTSCPSCGAVVEFAGATHATLCPFCATPVAVDTGSHRRLKPQALAPFVLTEPEAHDALTRWLGSLWFAPNRLLEFTRKGRAMTGIYVPFWSFDADTASRYTGQRGEHYYETRMVSVQVDGKQQMREERVQKTRWHSASGRVARFFDNILVMAATSLPKDLGNGLTPWNLDKLEPYAPDYLAGFQAEGYTVALPDGHAEARVRMERVIEHDIRRDIGGDEQRITSVDTDWRDESFKHVLLPVWTAAYRYGGKSYRFVINGQTGKVRGQRPWSWVKIALAVLVVAALVLGAVYLNDPQTLGLPAPE